MLYRVNEIFYSLQGEGHWTGTPFIFIRLSGCNLECEWCDTDHSNKMQLTAEQIVAKCVSLYPKLGKHHRRVVITGGEPTLQELGPLVTELKDKLFYIAIETNGTHMTMIPTQVDWITVSPKPGAIYQNVHDIKGDELKVVFDGEQDLSQFKRWDFRYYFIQPCSEDLAPALKYVKGNPRWRLSLQTHKMIEIQ